MDIFTNLWSIVKTIQFRDVVDILAIALLIFGCFKLIRETRAVQLLKGVLLLLAVYFLSSDEWRDAVKKSIVDAADTSVLFSRSRTGALLVFERETMLSDIASTGTIVDAMTSVALFGNIFFNKAPLHDGASIIRDGKLFAAGCILPLTSDKTVDINLGTRHRAALGISEQSDAVVLVVSEETGVISLAVGGVLLRDFSRETLIKKLNELLLDEFEEDESKIRRFRRGRKDK